MLDDLDQISKIDKSSMLEVIEKFPEQIIETVDIVNSTDITSVFKVDDIVLSGMGGSGVSGDIIQSFFRDKLDIPIYVNRGYDLPKWANKNTLLISQSYSGNTEETLSTFKHGFQKRCKIIGITSGGKLKEYCGKREIPLIKIPTGIAPRAATAYLLFSSFLILEKTGLLRDSMDSQIKETISTVKDFRDKNKKKIPEKDNISKQIAKKIMGTIPQVYGWGVYMPIAKRWCTQFNENSKIISRYDEVPECNHNDIVGWSSNPEATKKFTCILFRDEEEESVYMSKRLNFMKKLFDDVSSKTIEIHIRGKKRLAKMIYAMYLGDYVSCYLSVLRKVDPTPVVVIDELKKELSSI